MCRGCIFLQSGGTLPYVILQPRTHNFATLVSYVFTFLCFSTSICVGIFSAFASGRSFSFLLAHCVCWKRRTFDLPSPLLLPPRDLLFFHLGPKRTHFCLGPFFDLHVNPFLLGKNKISTVHTIINMLSFYTIGTHVSKRVFMPFFS